MEVYDAIRTVLAVRAYKDKPVPQEIILRIVEAARLTASSMNGQPWHFIIVKEPDTLKKLGALVRSGPYIAQAPLAIVVAMEKSIYAVSDASRAIQSMILTDWSERVASNWVGFENLTAVKPLLGIPDHIDEPCPESKGNHSCRFFREDIKPVRGERGTTGATSAAAALHWELCTGPGRR